MRKVSVILASLLLAVAGADESLEQSGLHNVHRGSDKVYLGSEARGEKAFAALRNLGIRTIVSVDGAAPDLVTAKKFGICCIHIPIGYDGIPEDAAKALTRVAREIDSPVYVHCHHGKHRGPAAAAMLCIAAGSMNNEQALKLMATSGTNRDYIGLWRDVRNFRPPAADALLPELVESAEVDPIPAVMAKLNRDFENLKLCASSEWRSPATQPDLVPSAEALLVREAFRETKRHLDAGHNEQFRMWLKQADLLAGQLYTAAVAADSATADELLKSLEQKCVQCHAVYR